MIRIVFDNVTPDGIRGDLWGFAAYLPRHKLLFDTGSNGRRLLRNMEAQGIDPAQIEHLFITHDHWDHIGGIDSILECNPEVTIWAPFTLSRNHLRDLRTLARDVIVVNRNEPRHLFDDLHTTGMLGGAVPEQSLIIASDTPTVLTGCGHYGIDRIVAKASEVIGRPIRRAAGGFHLLEADAKTIRGQIDALKRAGVTQVLPTHCTGEEATALFADAFQGGFAHGGVAKGSNGSV
jgi:7,8-dihydropterin-6-yl-methyl-4-(beta-D-ribofuranosyl)aminobenzene 5'-phosphate synthase